MRFVSRPSGLPIEDPVGDADVLVWLILRNDKQLVGVVEIGIQCKGDQMDVLTEACIEQDNGVRVKEGHAIGRCRHLHKNIDAVMCRQLDISKVMPALPIDIDAERAAFTASQVKVVDQNSLIARVDNAHLAR